MVDGESLIKQSIDVLIIFYFFLEIRVFAFIIKPVGYILGSLRYIPLNQMRETFFMAVFKAKGVQ